MRYKIYPILVFLTLLGCGQDKNQTSYSDLQADMASYLQDIQSRGASLFREGLLASADENVKKTVWRYSSDHGRTTLQLNRNNHSATYNFANAVTLGGQGNNMLLASDEHLANALGLSESGHFMVLQITSQSGSEIRGQMQLAPKGLLVAIKNALGSGILNLPRESLPMTQAFFRLAFSRANYSYTSQGLSIYQNMVDNILSNRQAYVTMASLHWMGNAQSNALPPSAPSHSPAAQPLPGISLEGKINMGINMYAQANLSDSINVYLEQYADQFLIPEAIGDAQVIVEMYLQQQSYQNHRNFNTNTLGPNNRPGLVPPYQMSPQNGPYFGPNNPRNPQHYGNPRWNNQNLMPYGDPRRNDYGMPGAMGYPSNPYANPSSRLGGNFSFNFGRPSGGLSSAGSPLNSLSGGNFSSLDSSDFVGRLAFKSLKPFRCGFEFSHNSFSSARISLQISDLTAFQPSGGILLISGVHRTNLIGQISDFIKPNTHNQEGSGSRFLNFFKHFKFW